MKSIITMTLLAAASAYSADATAKLPERAEKSYQAAEASFVKQYQTELTKLLKELERVKSEETKSGKLETALAVDALIKEVSAGKILKDALDSSNLDLLSSTKPTNPMPNPEKYIIGTWTRDDKRCTFGIFNDGNIHISWGDKPWKSGDKADAVGTWELFKHEGYIRLTYCGEYSVIQLPLTDGANKITDKNHVETTITKK